MIFLRIGDKMKKKILIGILISLTSVMFAQKTVSIESALDSAVSEIKNTVPSGVEIAVSRFSSDSQELSEWLAKETEARLIRTGKFKLLERNAKNLKLIDSEIDYQYSGNVDDSSMVELGYRLGAKYLVYGSFEQFGGLMQLTLKTTNVESGEIPVMVSYSISSSTKLTDLLGDERELNTAEDYLDMIARCQRKLTKIESEKNKEIQNITSNIFAKYQEEINKVKSIEKEPWEAQFEYDNKISSEIAIVEGKRDIELNGVESKVNIKYGNQYKMVELQMNKLVENLQNTSFVIKGDSVKVLLGTFKAEEKPKNWPVSIKSLDKLVNYTYNGKITVSDADVKTEYKTMENARASNSLEGEIIYKILRGSSNLDYEIKVVSVRVYNSENGTTVVNETVNQMVGSVSANAILSSQQNKSVQKEDSKKVTLEEEKSANKIETKEQSNVLKENITITTETRKEEKNYTEFLDYTGGQKFGFGIQNILFGLGSYRAGHVVDGLFLTLLHTAGIGCMVLPNIMLETGWFTVGKYYEYDYAYTYTIDWDWYSDTYDTMLISGIIIEGVAVLYGFLRPIFYHKKGMELSYSKPSNEFNFFCIPNRNGLVTQVSWKMNF